MIGIGSPNSQLEKFHDAIQAGEVLMMVDVPRARVHEVEDLVKKHHPEVDIEGTEPNIPNFP